MYTIKQIPEDFIVLEESNITPIKQGRYGYFKLWKREYTTMRALEHIAAFLNIPLKNIGFAGTKDKEAITEQIISIKKSGPRAIVNFKRDDIKLTFLGHGDEPISLGDLKGNNFEIVIRNIEKIPEKIDFTINYFDNQRFSTNNVAVGKAMLKGKWEEACELISDYSVSEYLGKNPKNYVTAVKTIPFRTLQLYIHSFQSWLWNEAVGIYLHCKYSEEELCTIPYTHGQLFFPKQKPKNLEFPIIGFGTEFQDKDIEEIYTNLLKKESLTERKFIIRAIPDLSSEGSSRDLIADVQNLKIGKLEDDDLNSEKKKSKVNFFLQKGSYATLAIKRMMA